MARLLVIALIALFSSVFAKKISVTIISGKCESNDDCLSGDTCSYGTCTFSKRGFVDLHSIGLPDGSLCLINKNCKNFCRKQRCTNKSKNGGPCDNNDDCFGKMICRSRICEYQGHKPTTKKPAGKKPAAHKSAPKPGNKKPVKKPTGRKAPTQKKSMPRPTPKKNTGKKPGIGKKPNSSKKTTVIKKPYKKPDGKNCVWNAECQGTCIFGTCRKPLDAGGICAFSSDCEGTLVCKNSKCQRDRMNGKRDGSKCKWDFQCKNVCIFGTCERLRRLGQMCMKNIHCIGDLKCTNGKCAERGY